MKKIIPILFLFLSIFACYIIYNLTEKDELNYTAIGDIIADNNYKQINQKIIYNNLFTNSDYRLTDILNIIKYNQEKELSDSKISIHQVLKKTDILIISLGMNDIYFKLEDDPNNIYTYINNMLTTYEKILHEINHYDYKQVFVLGYYNVTKEYQDIYTYLNYKLEKLTNTYHYTYIDLEHSFHNRPELLSENTKFYPNNQGKNEIIKILVENLKKTWYNIKRIYYYDLLLVMAKGETYEKEYSSKLRWSYCNMCLR